MGPHQRMQERSFFRGPPRLIGAPFWAVSGVFVPRHETAITIASDKESFSSYFVRAKVMAVSTGCAVRRAKVLAVSNLPRHRALCAKTFALLGLVWV